MKKMNLTDFGNEFVCKLIYPHSLDDFLKNYWQKQVLVASRDNDVFNADVLTMDDLDRLLSSTPLPASLVDMGRSAVGAPKATYTDGMTIKPQEILRRHKKGETIILRAMHLWLPQLASLCDAAGAFFCCEAQANIYMTPAGTQSSYPHWDAHDIFVIQIAGTKRWALHDSPMKQPLYSFQFDRNRHPIGPRISEFVLQPGDTAYVPRGMAHNPVAEDYSVHIALGVKVNTWSNVLTAMLGNLALDDVDFREALPVVHGQCNFDLKTAVAGLERITRKLANPATLQEALTNLSSEYRRTRRRDTRGFFTAFAKNVSVTLDSVMELPNTPAMFELQTDGCLVMFNGVELRIDTSIIQSIHFIRDNNRFVVRDLPAESDDHRLAIVQNLYEEGCLRFYDKDKIENGSVPHHTGKLQDTSSATAHPERELASHVT